MGQGNVSERGAESFSKSGKLSSVPFPMKKRRDSNVEGADMQKLNVNRFMPFLIKFIQDLIFKALPNI